MFPFGTVNSNPLYTNSPVFEIFALFDMLIISMVFLLFYAVDHPCILAAVSNIQFGSIACTEYSNHYSISVSHYNSFSIYRNSFSTHSNIFGDRESELYVSFISKRSNVSVWERVTILYKEKYMLKGIHSGCLLLCVF